MPITTLVYNVDRLPKSDHHQNNFSEVITEAFGDNVHKFMNDYTRQKKKHIEEFENIFSKFENLKESGLKIRLQDIPDRRRKNEASIRKEMRDGERLDHFTEELGTTDLSDTFTGSEFNDGLENCNEIGDNLPLKETRCKVGDHIPYPLSEDFRKKRRREEEASNKKEKRKKKEKHEEKRRNFPEKSGTPDLSDVFINSEIEEKANIEKEKREKKRNFSPFAEELDTIDLRKFFKSAGGQRKYIRIAEMLEREYSSLQRFLDNVTGRDLPEHRRKRLKPFIQRYSKEITNLMEILLALEEKFRLLKKLLELWDDENWIGEKHSVRKRPVYGNQVLKNTRSEKLDRTPYDVCEDSRRMPSNMKEKPLNFTKVPEKSGVAAASTGLARYKSKHANISNVHEKSYFSIASSDSESSDDQKSIKEQHGVKKHLVYDNQVVKNTRSQKGDRTPYDVCEDSKKMPSNMKEKPLNFIKVPEKPYVAAASTGSEQRKSKHVNISNVHEASHLSIAGSDSESLDDQNSIEELHAVKRPLVYDNEFVKNTRSEKLDHTPYDVCVDSRRIPSNMKDKPLNLTKFPEKSCVSAASTDSANMKDKPLNLTKVPEKSHVSAASAVSELTVDLENSNEEHHPVKTVCDDQVVKETRSKEGDLILRVMLEDLKKMPAYKKHKLLNSAKVSEKSDLATERTGSARRKRKLANFANIHETSNLSTASSDSVKKGGKSANITKGAKISAGFKSVKKGGKSASITKGAKISADFKSARKKSKRANITNVHKTSDLSTASSGSEMNVDNNSRKENVSGNQSVEISRFEKEHVPFPSLKCLRKHPSKDNGINMLVNKSVSTEIPVKYSKDNNLLEVNKAAKCLSMSQNDYSDTAPECSEYDSNKTTDQVTKSSSRKSKFSNTDKNFKYLNNGDKISVFSVVKSWNSNNRFKKYLWHGIVPICPLTRSPQTSSRVAQSFLPLDVVSTITRSSYPLPPQTF